MIDGVYKACKWLEDDLWFSAMRCRSWDWPFRRVGTRDGRRRRRTALPDDHDADERDQHEGTRRPAARNIDEPAQVPWPAQHSRARHPRHHRRPLAAEAARHSHPRPARHPGPARLQVAAGNRHPGLQPAHPGLARLPVAFHPRLAGLRIVPDLGGLIPGFPNLPGMPGIPRPVPRPARLWATCSRAWANLGKLPTWTELAALPDFLGGFAGLPSLGFGNLLNFAQLPGVGSITSTMGQLHSLMASGRRARAKWAAWPANRRR